jgi:hypothetical protein
MIPQAAKIRAARVLNQLHSITKGAAAQNTAAMVATEISAPMETSVPLSAVFCTCETMPKRSPARSAKKMA